MPSNVAPIASAGVNQALLNKFRGSFDDFDYDNLPPQQHYAVAGLIPSGKVTLLVGAGAIGKTHLLLDLSQKCAYPSAVTPEGRDLWLGSDVNVDGPVIYVSAEEDRDDFHSRLADLNCRDRKTKHNDRIYVLDKSIMAGNPLFTLNRDNVESTESFRALRALAEEIRPSMIVIDTLNSLCPVDVDKNTAHGQAVMQRLGLVASECGAAIVVTHHISKTDITSRASARAAIKGTTGVVDGARCAIVVWNAPEKKGRAAMESGIVTDEAELFVAAVVKANAKGADLRERYFTRDMSQGGIMREVTNDMPVEPKKDETAPAPRRGRGRPKKSEA